MASDQMDTDPDPSVQPEDLDQPETMSIITCALCGLDFRDVDSEEHLNKAKLLICFHSVCHDCVSSWRINEFKACRKCLKMTKLEDLHDNKILQEILEEPHSNANGNCIMHADLPTIKYCVDCNQAVCNTCIESHAQLIITRNHNMVDFSHMPTEPLGNVVNFKCPLHPKETMDIFCKDCDTITCKDCYIKGTHRNHDFETDILQMSTDLKKEMFKKKLELYQTRAEFIRAEEILKKKVKDAKKQQSDITKELDDCCESVVEALKQKFTDLKNKLDKMIQEDTQKLNNLSKINESKVSNIDQVMSVIDLLSLRVSDTNIMFNKRHFKKCVETLTPPGELGEFPDPDVKRTYKLDNMDQLFQELSNYLLRLGSVIHILEPPNDNAGAIEPSPGPNAQMTPVVTGQTTPGLRGQTTPSPPVRLRPTGDLQSPEAREPPRRVSQDAIQRSDAASPSSSSSGMPSWHTPQQQSTATPTAPTSITLGSLLETTISPVRPAAVTLPVKQMSNATISPVRQEPVQNAARAVAQRPSNASAPHVQQSSNTVLRTQQQRIQQLHQQQLQLQQQHHQLQQQQHQQQLQQQHQQLQQQLEQQAQLKQFMAPQLTMTASSMTQVIISNPQSYTGLPVPRYPQNQQQSSTSNAVRSLQRNSEVSLTHSPRHYPAAPGRQQQEQSQQQQSQQPTQFNVAHCCALCNVPYSVTLAAHLFDCPRLADVRNQFQPDESYESKVSKLTLAGESLRKKEPVPEQSLLALILLKD